MKKGLILALVGLPFTAMLSLLGVAVLVNPALTSQELCTAGSVALGPIPDTLQAATAGGDTVTLDGQQLTHAATIIQIGLSTPGVGTNGILVALMAALTESSLRQLSNVTAYPDSANYPNDGDGHDHDSLGLFQMRPESGWGTVADLMDPNYEAHAFYGGPNGPNHGSPAGLLDITGWQQLDLGQAAQAVEVSAYPDRYANEEPVARIILTALTNPTATSQTSTPTAAPLPSEEPADDSIPPTGCATGNTGSLAAGDPGPDNNGAGFAPNPTQVQEAIAFADAQLGKPYAPGGAGPDVWDCSGLTMMAYLAAGIDIGPHSVTAQLAQMGSEDRLLPYADRERGDLIFWQEADGGFEHVAIYLGHDTILAAPQLGENVKIQPIWSTSSDHLYGQVARPTGTP
jgi:cell wall-associated NlpC family hydrolase